MADDRVSPKENAEFVKVMIDRDLRTTRFSYERLDYLKIIGDYIDEVGEKILSADRDKNLPSNFPEVPKVSAEEPIDDVFDVNLHDAMEEIFGKGNVIPIDGTRPLDIIDKLFRVVQPKYLQGAKTPIEFMRDSECLRDADASEWLYRNKYTHIYPHIHVHEDYWCALLDDEHEGDRAAWIKPDGVHMEGDLLGVMRAMFSDYIDKFEVEKSDDNSS